MNIAEIVPPEIVEKIIRAAIEKKFSKLVDAAFVDMGPYIKNVVANETIRLVREEVVKNEDKTREKIIEIIRTADMKFAIHPMLQ